MDADLPGRRFGLPDFPQFQWNTSGWLTLGVPEKEWFAASDGQRAFPRMRGAGSYRLIRYRCGGPYPEARAACDAVGCADEAGSRFLAGEAAGGSREGFLDDDRLRSPAMRAFMTPGAYRKAMPKELREWCD